MELYKQIISNLLNYHLLDSTFITLNTLNDSFGQVAFLWVDNHLKQFFQYLSNMVRFYLCEIWFPEDSFYWKSNRQFNNIWWPFWGNGCRDNLIFNKWVFTIEYVIGLKSKIYIPRYNLSAFLKTVHHLVQYNYSNEHKCGLT